MVAIGVVQSWNQRLGVQPDADPDFCWNALQAGIGVVWKLVSHLRRFVLGLVLVFVLGTFVL